MDDLIDLLPSVAYAAGAILLLALLPFFLEPDKEKEQK